MKGILIILLFTTIAFGLFNSCYYDSKEYLYPELSASCDTTNVTFSVSVKNVLSNSCLSCHSNGSAASSGGSIKLQDYVDVKVYAVNGSLMKSILHTGPFPMPKNGGSLSTCEINIIQKWIDAQMPNN